MVHLVIAYLKSATSA